MNTPEPRTDQRPPKITPYHLDRWAVVYVRQSHPQQVQRHRESAEVQANLQQRAVDWGWPGERIRILDGDQGCSGTTTAGRDDFAWLLSEISLGHVGLVLGFQINRLAREDEACCRLLKLCALFDTLLADQDGLYHPLDFNDRLIVTIKGILGGFELYQLQQRMQAGRLNRARRGEWLGQPPPGYVIGPDRKLQFDPDAQVQSVIRIIFDQYLRLGSQHGVLRYLLQHHIDLPYRPLSGPHPGPLQWHRPQDATLRHLLWNPAYAGTYTWGRRVRDPRRAGPGQRGSGRVEREPHQCAVYLPDNHAAYLSHEQDQRLRRLLQQPRRRGPVPGPQRATVAILAGLVVCGCCGSRMQTRYTRNVRYDCQRHALDDGGPACQSLVGQPLEQLIRDQVLQVVTPASLALSLHAAAECARQRDALTQHWHLRLERVRQDTTRAYRQYNAVEPENRLVARTLERQWEEALQAQRTLEEDYARFRQTQPQGLTAAEQAQIEALAQDLPALWQSPQTAVTDLRQVVRLLLERVVVWAPASSQEVTVQLHWSGGTVTEHRVMRPVLAWKQVAGAAALWQRVQAWQAAGWSAQGMAEALNAAGYQTPRAKPFTAANVRQLLARGGPEGTARHPGKAAKAKRSRQSRGRGSAQQRPAESGRSGPSAATK